MFLSSHGTQLVSFSAILLNQEWYPCIDHQCGCESAKQCRTECCCFPKVKKLEKINVSLSCCGTLKGQDQEGSIQRIPCQSSDNALGLFQYDYDQNRLFLTKEEQKENYFLEVNLAYQFKF